MRSLRARTWETCGGVVLLWLAALWAAGHHARLRYTAAAQQSGAAVVINAERAPKAQLPDLSDLQVDPTVVAQRFRDANAYVASDPTGLCIAVTAPNQVSDKELVVGDLPSRVMAAGIAERTTAEQLGARKKGYLSIDSLSDVQRAAALHLARRYGLVDDKGQPTEKDTRVFLGIGRAWETFIAVQEAERTTWHKLWIDSRPPSQEAIDRPPLSGAILWWTWPQRGATWGEQRVSVEARTYELHDLLTRLSQDSGLSVVAVPPDADTRLAVAAKDISVKSLLWAIGIATGLEVRTLKGPGPPIVIGAPVPGEKHQKFESEADEFRPMPALGYYTPSSAAMRGELMLLEGGPTKDSEQWIGWRRLIDLPLLYQNQASEAWEASWRAYNNRPAPPLDPDRTLVLWVKAVMLAIELQREDGSGGGYEFCLPAL